MMAEIAVVKHIFSHVFNGTTYFWFSDIAALENQLIIPDLLHALSKLGLLVTVMDLTDTSHSLDHEQIDERTQKLEKTVKEQRIQVPLMDNHVWKVVVNTDFSIFRLKHANNDYLFKSSWWKESLLIQTQFFGLAENRLSNTFLLFSWGHLSLESI